MIERYNLFSHEFEKEMSREIRLFSIISQSFFQPFSLMDNLIVILTALTAGSGVGFNRAMLFLTEGNQLKGKLWLGPNSAVEARTMWEILSIPGIGYPEIIEYNRAFLTSEHDSLTHRIKDLVYPLDRNDIKLPAAAAKGRDIVIVRDAGNEPAVDKDFLDILLTEEFLCLPLTAGNESQGQIILDNAITGTPIQQRDAELAGICGLIAANYIYTTSLQKRMVEIKKLAAMGEMAMFITHQVRNPLVTIGGFAEQALQSPLPDQRVKRNLRIINSEVKRLEKTLFRLTRFLKVEIKEMVPVDVEDLLKLVVSGSLAKAGTHGVLIRIEVEKGIPAVLCEPIYLGEALRNVLDNALDAMPDGGEALVCAYREGTNWLVMAIKDTGRGIPEAMKGKIFDAFTSAKEEGLGMGLAYVKRVMDACGGKIEVDSREGQGTTFKLYLKTQEKGDGDEKASRC